jgi:hypothetical protein
VLVVLVVVVVVAYVAVVDNADNHLACLEVLQRRHCPGCPWVEAAEQLEGQVRVRVAHTRAKSGTSRRRAVIHKSALITNACRERIQLTIFEVHELERVKAHFDRGEARRQ